MSEQHALRPRRIDSQNVVHRLDGRRVSSGPPGAQWYGVRRLHQNVLPNFTVVNVEKPPCFLRKFSPDGRYFVAFSADQTSLEIYRYRGCQAAEDLLQDFDGDVLVNGVGAGSSAGADAAGSPGGPAPDPRAAAVCSRLFERFFELAHVTAAAPPGEHLNRECSLFTDDCRHVVVGSAAYHPDDQQPMFYEVYRNNESVTPNPRSPLEDYSLHIVDLHTGRLCDSRHFKCDKIFLSHNQGLYLYRNILAVLSVQQQTIHVFQVTSEGTFIDVRSIGRFCYEDDLLTLGAVYPCTHPGGSGNANGAGVGGLRAFCEPTINSLKHRLLVHLWRRAEREGDATARRRFFQRFDQLRALRMWKMQLLDESHLLVKYAGEDVVTLKVTDPSQQPSFFVVYNMVSTEVLAVFENTSEELLDLFENFCDLFRNATLHSDAAQFPCSASSNNHARQIQRRFKHTIINAKYGGNTEAVKRLLAQLPISAQSYSSSPYLDLSLFSYDDKWVSVMERPKACGDHPIRFYARDSGLLKFKIQAGMLGRPVPPSARRLVAFTFHPSEPFAISVQRTNAEYVVNFHMRHVCTKELVAAGAAPARPGTSAGAGR
ncbi:DET1 homolog isoform X1 [Petromyzon marinus]|uniref:DET1 homolog isoform X1 n=1 Tax=Petromyzon marinus TaxID=7757 RepID=A0AAJ7XER4_PETMA|nr:DET1 homolog isoform X1 [Petromyzon marinus]XP_032831743.1 DET1 homolog isoform X1 [Petromyzon marinus]XP_032831744.1 DET1 homolog isoform X1 [Petromyzon marinus]XP_032831745.1 DET1 homolog isoform X1 [Petromyzon marinus]XP_032831746.1 DET1 homolog isoform X1 [Petromyzon marinus]